MDSLQKGAQIGRSTLHLYYKFKAWNLYQSFLSLEEGQKVYKETEEECEKYYTWQSDSTPNSECAPYMVTLQGHLLEMRELEAQPKSAKSATLEVGHSHWRWLYLKVEKHCST